MIGHPYKDDRNFAPFRAKFCLAIAATYDYRGTPGESHFIQ